MRKVIILAICLFGMGCSAVPAVQSNLTTNAEFLTDTPHSFFNKPDEIESK